MMYTIVKSSAIAPALLSAVIGNPDISETTSSIDKNLFVSRAFEEPENPTSSGVKAPVLEYALDPWTESVLEKIASYRNLGAPWNGPVSAPIDEDSLDTAETLAYSFGKLPMNRRPQFAVDTNGKPSFSAHTGDLYLHLTIEQADVISWYRVADGVESFGDDVAVNSLSADELVEEIIVPTE